MRATHTPRILALATAGLLATALSGCTGAPDGGLDTLPTAAPTNATMTPAEDAVPAPAFDALLVDGATVPSADLWKNTPVILYFTASWCTQCAEQQDEINTIAKDYDGAVTVVLVSSDDSLTDAQKLATDSATPGPVIFDTGGEITRRYAVTEPPATAIVDTNGGIVKMWLGGGSAGQIRAALDEVVAVK
ncbi:hypothetical protein GCM10022198_09280 [Klugiella xanthotipulae]|uniref:Peroxiredoxin n=1 Tax=Klugiella xanthotipulae TaxID=244735 RepID=A0A543I655_9MICO|nr:TlpA disulfide reductase family protein [Klugiella xanthotipulae]TQM66057.1 peroxiredoxin [Klugiella xanthotipulae]